MRQTMDELAVVGQQDEAECVRVEASDRNDSAMRSDQIENRRPAARVGRGGYDTGRLVQDDVGVPRVDVDTFAVDLDARALWIDAHPLDSDDLAVDRYTTFVDQLFGGPA